MTQMNEWIKTLIDQNDVVLFMKGTPAFPQCGFSSQVAQLLDLMSLEYQGINVLQSDELREGIKAYADWPTIPQLYIKGTFVGGCDIILEMYQAGELQDMLRENAIPFTMPQGAQAN